MADGMFAGDHGPENAWRSEKGSMLAPHLQMPLESTNEGPDRLNQEVSNGVQKWDAFIKPYEPLTRGGGTMAK